MTNKKQSIIIIIITIVVAFCLMFLYLYNKFKPAQTAFDENNIGELYYSPIDPEHVAETDNGFMYADNEVLVVAKQGTAKKEIEKLAKKYDAEIVGYIEQTGDYQWKFDNTLSYKKLNEITDELKEYGLINDAYCNYISESSVESVSDDIIYGERWSDDLKNATDNNGLSWGVEAINAPAAWTYMNDHKADIDPIRVGLIDSGFDETHHDLCFAKVFYDNGSNDQTVSNDKKQHGTHTAGTMAANGTNTEGVNGVYPYCTNNNRLLFAASLNGTLQIKENGQYNTSAMFEKIAIAELVLRNVKVINHSINNRSARVRQIINHEEGWKNALDELTKNANIEADFFDRLLGLGYDFIIVSAAGNDPDGNEVNQNWESKYNSFINAIDNSEKYRRVYNRIIVVGAVNSNYNITAYSYAGDRVDIFAPGGDGRENNYIHGIQSTFPTNRYAGYDSSIKYMAGTSMASPHVAGVCANVWSINNDLTGEQVKDIVLNSIVVNSECPRKENVTDDNYNDILNKQGYRGIYKYPVVDCNKAVRTALMTKGLSEESDKNLGAVLGWVVEQNSDGSAADEKNSKISGATIKVYSNSKKHEEITVNGVTEWTTDDFGHYEILLPEGDYLIEASKSGYKELKGVYSVAVKVRSQQVTYAKWIELEKEDSTEAVDNTKIDEKTKKITYDEKALKKKLEKESRGKIAEWSYCDYDGDGKKEAFAIIGDKSTKALDAIWFISDSGKTTLMRNSFSETGFIYSYNDLSSNKYEGQKFFVVNEAGGNYNMPAYIFGVNDKKPIEYSPSGNYTAFYFKDDILYAGEYDHDSGSLSLNEYVLKFDDDGDLYIAKTDDVIDSNKTETPAEKYARIVMDNKEVWYTPWNDASEDDGVYSTCAWFQDLDFDDIPEFIVGKKSVTIQTMGYGYDIFKFTDNDEMIKLNADGYMNNSIMIFSHFNYIGIRLPCMIYKDYSGNYHCMYDEVNNSISQTGFYLKELSIENNNMASVILYDYLYLENNTEYYKYKDIDYSREDFIAQLDNELDSDAFYSANIGVIPFGDKMSWLTDPNENSANAAVIHAICPNYDSLSNKEKKQVLIDSYQAYSLEEVPSSSSYFEILRDEIDRLPSKNDNNNYTTIDSSCISTSEANSYAKQIYTAAATYCTKMETAGENVEDKTYIIDTDNLNSNDDFTSNVLKNMGSKLYSGKAEIIIYNGGAPKSVTFYSDGNAIGGYPQEY